MHFANDFQINKHSHIYIYQSFNIAIQDSLLLYVTTSYDAMMNITIKLLISKLAIIFETKYLLSDISYITNGHRDNTRTRLQICSTANNQTLIYSYCHCSI